MLISFTSAFTKLTVWIFGDVSIQNLGYEDSYAVIRSHLAVEHGILELLPFSYQIKKEIVLCLVVLVTDLLKSNRYSSDIG